MTVDDALALFSAYSAGDLTAGKMLADAVEGKGMPRPELRVFPDKPTGERACLNEVSGDVFYVESLVLADKEDDDCPSGGFWACHESSGQVLHDLDNGDSWFDEDIDFEETMCIALAPGEHH